MLLRAASAPAGHYTRWQRGPSHDESFFPVAVWLQSPANAGRYRAAGFNLYVGLWKGPTQEQLRTLTQAGMRVICHQNAVGRAQLDNPIIVGWMHGDEPDNAQSLGRGKGYGPPIEPEKIVADYQRIRAVDPNRPVLLNLGQGVAWDGWRGRGVRTGHPEDYRQYVQGCDIASFDIYPVTHSKPEIAGKLWYVARGVERLRQWAGPERIVWNCIECTRIHNPTTKPTPQQVRCEVWMSIVHGSMGLIYFVHEWEPRFNESALLSDPEMLAAVAKTNAQIHQLAPVLNRPTVRDAVRAGSQNADVPIATMAKQHDGALYVFAVAMRPGQTRARFRLADAGERRRAEVLDESRTLPVRDGVFSDDFEPWDVHIYRVAGD
jgi:hypothetical protein